jgi:Calx-beta domain
VSQTAIPSGGAVTATWGGIAGPTSTDWIGLYRPGDENSTFFEWIYTSCSQTPGSPRASGSCSFTVPSTLAPGNYQLRLFARDDFNHLAASGAFTVGASPGVLQFSAATYSVGENGGSAAITIMRTGGANGAVGATFTTSNGTATAPSDYTAVTQTVSFAAGDTANKSISIPIVNDTVAEGNETLNMTLSNPTGGATLSGISTAVLTVTDDDVSAAGALQFSTATYSVAENGGNATVTITRTGGSTGAVGVTVATSNGTATAPSDYTAVTQTVSFANGDTANKTVSIPIVDDTVVEGSETLNVALSSPTGGATLGSTITAAVTVTDNDVAAPPGTLQFSAATYSVAENGGNATITVTRAGGSAGAVGVTVATSNGTATAPSDYTAVTQTVSFATGDTANKTINVPIINNTINEPAETVNLTLSSPTGGATVGNPGSAVLTITDDDSAPSPTLTASPTTIARGNPVTASWSAIPTPTPGDWIGLYTPGAANTTFVDWIYVSCSKTRGGAAASGSCPFVVPATVPAGTYELRISGNDSFSLLATSNSFTVTAPGGPTLMASPTTIARGNSMTASWSGISTPTPGDWIGLYTPGAANTAFVDWIYVSCTKTRGGAAASGSCPFVVPSTVTPGMYQLRIFANDQFSLLATSNAFTVQ